MIEYEQEVVAGAELKTSVAMENAEPFQYRPVLFCLRLTSTFWTPEPVPLAEPVIEVRVETAVPVVTDEVGASVSIVTLRLVEATLVLPATSVALAVMMCVPSVKALVVML